MAEHPVTRREVAEALGATKVELKAELSAMKNEILEAVREMIRELQKATLERTQEMIRDSQTEVLKAFFSFQDGADIRMRTTEAKLSNVDTGRPSASPS